MPVLKCQNCSRQISLGDGVGYAGLLVCYPCADALRASPQAIVGPVIAPAESLFDPPRATRAVPKKCYYCGRSDGRHVGGCEPKPSDAEIAAAERETARVVTALERDIAKSTPTPSGWVRAAWAKPLKPIATLRFSKP